MDTRCEICGCGLICLGEVLMCPECGNLTETDESLMADYLTKTP